MDDAAPARRFQDPRDGGLGAVISVRACRFGTGAAHRPTIWDELHFTLRRERRSLFARDVL